MTPHPFIHYFVRFKLRIKTLNHDLQETNDNEEPCVVPGNGNEMEQNCNDVNDNTSLYQVLIFYRYLLIICLTCRRFALTTSCLSFLFNVG